MVLHCWDDIQTGNTFIGMWIQDIASGQWALYSYYDTKLKNSVMTGDMHFFLENFAPLEANYTRKFKVNGIYAKDASDDSWKSITSATQEYTCGENGAIGSPSFGRDNYYSYFWGNITPQNTDPKLNPFAQTKTSAITQPSTPKFGEPKKNVGFNVSRDKNSNVTVTWSPDITSTPQLSYEVKVYDKNGECKKTVKQTRPDVTSCTVSGIKLDGDQYSCALTLTDIFGNSITQTYSTPLATKSISIANNPTKTTYYLGDPLNTNGLALNVKYGNGATKKVTSGFTTYGFDSKTTGVKKVTVNYGGATATYNVTVKKPSVTITNPVLEMYRTDTASLNAVTEPANSTVEWSSNNPYYVTVDKKTGKLTAVHAFGKATITASIKYNGVIYSSSFEVKTLEPRITWNFPKDLSPFNKHIKPGEMLRLYSVVNVPGNQTVWYEVSDKSVAKITWDIKYFYVECLKPGEVDVVAKFKHNGQIIESSPIHVIVTNK